MLQRQILVTGAAGYVGSVLCRQLLARGFRVKGLDKLLFGDAGIVELYQDPRFQFLNGDLCDAKTRQRALTGVDAVIHLAAIVGDPACKKFPEEATALMDVASRELFLEAESRGVQRFVFASTCSNYGQMDGDALLDENAPLQPQSHYARLKVEHEMFLSERMPVSPVAISILRFATAYGLSPRMRFDLTVNHFTRDIALGKELLVFGEQQWRPYCHVHDIAQAICLAVSQAPETATGIFNIGDSHENYTKAMIVSEILRQFPAGIVAFGPQNDPDTRNYRVNFDKARHQLQFVANRRVSDGIKEIAAMLLSKRIHDPFATVYQNC